MSNARLKRKRIAWMKQAHKPKHISLLKWAAPPPAPKKERESMLNKLRRLLIRFFEWLYDD